MAHLDTYRRYSEASRSQGDRHPPNSNTPRAQTSSPTFQQLLHGEASLWSPGSSPKLRRHVDHEEDHSPHNRKSVLAKVKDRARKLRHSLSGKKHHQEHNLYSGNKTPSWGVSLEDYEDEEDDPEYLGAPMYESELAPANYKETAKQHPRKIYGVSSENQVVPSSVNKGVVHEKEEHLSPNKTMTETMSEKLGPAYVAVSETMSEKFAPACAAVSEVTHNVATKIANLTVSTPEGTEFGVDNTGSGINNKSSLQIWDKGVSVKEYLMQKFEPGEDEKALSQVISETISPRRTTGDLGMVEKMKGTVSSFLWPEEPSQASTYSTKSSMDIPNTHDANTSSSIPVSTTKTSSSSQASLSHTSASTTKTSSPSSSSLPSMHASAINVGSSSRTSPSPTNASISPPNVSTTKTSSSSHTSLSPNASTTKSGSSSYTSQTPSNTSRPKTRSSSHTSPSHNNASTTKVKSSPRTSLSLANASTTKAGSSFHTSLTPTNASTTKTSSLPHISTVSASTSPRSAIGKRSLSVHAPVSTTTTTSATKTSSSTHKPFSTNEKSLTQIPVSTYVTEVIEEENNGRVPQAN